MCSQPRVARPGDVCILLEPMAEDLVDLRQRQRKLQRVFGGQVHEPVHLTCQRFRPEGSRPVRDVIQSLAQQLAEGRSLPIVAESLEIVEHPFWRSRLLRWRVPNRLDLTTFCRRLEQVLDRKGIRVHFPSTQGWLPGYVTALEDVPDGGEDGIDDRFSFPDHLFDARRVVFSLVEGRERFRILEEIELAAG